MPEENKGASAPLPPAPSQTGGTGVPVQVENVQYSVPVGKVRSKIGLATFVMALIAWVIAGILGMFLLLLRERILPFGEIANTDFAGIVVFLVAFLIPVAPIFWYVHKRVHEMLAENPAVVDDLFFKKTIRFHLLVSVFLAVLCIGIAAYNILAKLFLPDVDITAGPMLDSIIFALVASGLAFFFLSYQRLTKR